MSELFIDVMSNKIKPIGIFDSGLGGLEILKHIIKELPQYDYLYLGDSARTPYGSRSQELIYQFTKQAVDFLFKQGCPLVILACNTASSEALRRLQQEYLPCSYPNNRILGVIIPAAEAITETSLNKSQRIGIIATQGAVSSQAFPREIIKINPKAKIFQQACPLLVPIIEAGEHKSNVAEQILIKYLKPLLAKKIDTLILGCTHYGLIERQIKKIVGPTIKIITEGSAVGQKLLLYLQRHPEINSSITKNQDIKFLTTDLTNNFQKLGNYWFGQPIKIQKISLN